MKFLTYVAGGLMLAAAQAPAAPLISDDFTYTDGNLVGQGPWLQTSTATATPIQVSSGQAVLGTSGQDTYAAFAGGPLTLTDGTSIYTGLTLDVTAAQATGDYFLHYTPAAGNSSTFISRLFVKSSGAGYVLGWAETSGATTTYGSTVLTFGTNYRIVVAYNDVAGALNDTGAVYVNPTDLTVEANNTAYLTKAYTSATAETEAFAAVNFRQGTASSAPSLIVDNLNVGTSFADVSSFAAVPEPQSLAVIGGFSILGLNFIRRRRK